MELKVLRQFSSRNRHFISNFCLFYQINIELFQEKSTRFRHGPRISSIRFPTGNPIGKHTFVVQRRINGEKQPPIFHAPGKLGRFETKSPGLFLIGRKRVFAADPSARLAEITILLDGVSRQLRLPDGEQAGSSVAADF